MRTLLVDNYDSYTFNLFQLIAEIDEEEPIVVRNDGASWEEIRSWEFDKIVLSPGPGHPARERDFGVCRAAIESAEAPLLGVCLGHQGLAQLEGGAVVHAPEVMHGRLSEVEHDGKGLFAGLPQGFRAVRYHSLAVAQPLPGSLEVTAWTRDGVVMGLRHRSRPQWGVQFHPESICTEHGRRLFANFRTVVPAGARRALTRERLRAVACEVAAPPDAETAFASLFGDEPHAFWLDSSKLHPRLGRFSFMGGTDGPRAALVTYDVERRQVEVEAGGRTEVLDGTLFEYLDRRLGELECDGSGLPFDFCGGFVGYFGYELKADCGAERAYASPLPDAVLFFADRFVAFDHVEERAWAVALAAPGELGEARSWARATAEELAGLDPLDPPPELEAAPRPVQLSLSRSYETYVDDIEECRRRLVDGETYEVCLTNRAALRAELDPLRTYRILRAVNPAPFSAFLRLGEAAVLCSSPERFLRVDGERWVETKPIKGTAPRGGTPAEDEALAEELRTSEKDRAENLMIVDLMRNDLGLVCEVGSVHVPALMAIETYETVHQLVSTIRGRLRGGLGVVDCLRACFPGGSMTGAPKRRTMEIIDELEGEARGVYSGAIGFLGLNGTADLNIVIRTIVASGGSLSIGAGGAIVVQSDPEREFDEMLLKTQALRHAIGLALAAELELAGEPGGGRPA